MIRKGLIGQVQQEIKEKQHQEALRKQHGIEDNNVVVVEKKNMTKFFIKLLIGSIKTIAGIALIILAGIGAIALIYPDIRTELMTVLLAIADDAANMTGLQGLIKK